jgi:phosphate transport system permease protein
MSSKVAAQALPNSTHALFVSRAGDVAQAPSRGQLVADRLFRTLCLVFAAFTVLLVAFIVLKIAVSAAPAMREYGFGFLTGRVWDPNTARYGILGEIWGTVYTSVLALMLGSVFGVSVAIFLSEGYLSHLVYRLLHSADLQLHPLLAQLPDQLERLLKTLIELLAAIPSVVYGLWGLFVVIPFIRPYCNWLHLNFGWFPPFGSELSGPGIMPAVIVLSIMILPTITAISRDALVSVPSKLRMAAYGLGATRWETIIAVILPTASRGIIGGIILALGRALGETMALAMLAGNSNQITLSLFSPANTLAALLANNFPEAGAKQVGVLMYAALVLLGITLIVNIVGALIIRRAALTHAD